MNKDEQENKLLNALVNDILDNKVSIVFITGDLATGKSYFSDILSYILAKCGQPSTIISIDNFLLDRRYRHSHKNIYDMPLLSQLRKIRNLNHVEYPGYDYSRGIRTNVDRIQLNPIIIIEGSLLTRKIDVASQADRIIYIKKRWTTKLRYLLKRDSIEKDYNFMQIITKFTASRKSFRNFIKRFEPQADYIFEKCRFHNHLSFSEYRTGKRLIIDEIFREDLDKIKNNVDHMKLSDKETAYRIISQVVCAVLDKKDKNRSFLKNHCIFSRGNLAIGELVKSSDWDITIYAKHSLFDKKTSLDILKAIEYVHSPSKNTGGVLDSARICNPSWDQELIYTTSMLNTEHIIGNTKAYDDFKNLLHNRIKDSRMLKKLARQTEIRRKLFSTADLKNGYGGMRDLQTLIWLYQLKNNLINNSNLKLGKSFSGRLLNKLLKKYFARYKQAKMQAKKGTYNRIAFAFERTTLAVIVSLKIRKLVS